MLSIICRYGLKQITLIFEKLQFLRLLIFRFSKRHTRRRRPRYVVKEGSWLLATSQTRRVRVT